MIEGEGFGGLLRRATRENLLIDEGNRQAWDYLERILNGESWIVLMYGATGLGKTFMMAVLANEIEKKYRGQASQVYWTAAGLAYFRRKSETDPIEGILETDVLYLDDLGAEYVTEYWVEGLYVILNRRILDEKPLVMATNADLGELRKKYGERFFSRLGEPCAAVVEVKGRNRRAFMPQEVGRWAERVQSRLSPRFTDEEDVPPPPDVRETLARLGLYNPAKTAINRPGARGEHSDTSPPPEDAFKGL